ncbi:MAG: ATP-binding cassette domain-containing protein [Streptococcus sp.]|nr:ATP-binding cassette domain-containing protein [Streptococcus sp.]
MFALLGHNGAGKTTTINCLSGMLSKSSGHAEVMGVDVFNNTSKLRKIMGMCPHNILFPLLTPWEHLSMI